MTTRTRQKQTQCPCGCGKMPSKNSHYAMGHDQRVLSWIGWDDPKVLKQVDWHRVPITPAWRGFEPLVADLRERQAKGDWDAETD